LRTGRLASLVLVTLLLFGGRAAAQPDKAALAEVLFQEASALVQAGKLAEACPKFLASHKADPSYGAVFNLGECYLRTGKTASAWAAFVEAAGVASKASEHARVADATSRAKALEPKLSRLAIVVKANDSGLSVRRDGVDIDPAAFGASMPVDPGEHTIEASAPGKKAFTTTVQARGEGQTVTVEVPPLASAGPAPSPRASAAPAASAGPSDGPAAGLGTQRGLAIAAAALGLVGAGVGAALGFTAKSKWDSVSAQCDGAGKCASSEAVKTGNEARSLAQGSTVGFAASGAALAGAVLLWITAPKAAPAASGAASARVGGFVNGQGGGLVVVGKF
jgi:hypothetical protein